MKVISWDKKRAQILASLASVDAGVEARSRRIQEVLKQAEEERLLREAAKLTAPVLDVPEPVDDDLALAFLPLPDEEAPAALPMPEKPEPEPFDFLGGDLPDVDLPSEGQGKKAALPPPQDDPPPVVFLEE